jgi:hypothetical protein
MVSGKYFVQKQLAIKTSISRSYQAAILLVVNTWFFRMPASAHCDCDRSMSWAVAVCRRRTPNVTRGVCLRIWRISFAWVMTPPMGIHPLSVSIQGLFQTLKDFIEILLSVCFFSQVFALLCAGRFPCCHCHRLVFCKSGCCSRW